MSDLVRIRSKVERKYPQLPRFIVVPSDVVTPWKLEQTTVVEGTVNGFDLGRRTLKKWDDARWFIELTEPICQKSGIDTGASVVLELKIASDRLPDELAKLISDNANARKVWTSLTPSSQRMLREHVAAGKQSATRQRRALQGLGMKRS